MLNWLNIELRDKKGRFAKGNQVFHKNGMLGKRHSEETKKKMSESQKGKYHSDKTKLKISLKSKGRMLGWKHNEETKIKLSIMKQGDKCHFWKGGITPETKRLRMSKQLREWRNNVFERDNFICRKCNKKGGHLNAHHIVSWATCPEKRFDIDNGITLCLNCHRELHKRIN